MRCILCGAEFPPAWVALPTKSGETQKRFPKEVCDACADPKQRPAVRRSYPFSTGYMVLAGSIEHLVIQEYSHAYHKALETMQGIRRLEAIGMDWQTADERFWNESYQKCKSYFE